MMRWKLSVLIALVAVLGLPVTAAQATGPTLLQTTPAAGATGQARYGTTVTFTYDQPVGAITTASLTRIGTGTVVPVSATVDGADVVLTAGASLVSNTAYIASVLTDPEASPDTVTFTTLRPPAHPALRVKVITALAPEAAADIVHRLDLSNLLAVPRASDLVDVSLATGRPLTTADLAGYHAALVVTDRDVDGQDALATVLAWFCAHGHGVVVAGQAHWKPGPLWTAASSISTSYLSSWSSQWSPYGLTNPVASEGGALAGTTVSQHFVTRALRTPFTVIGPGSGEYYTQTTWNASILARLAKTAAFPSWGQALVAVRSIGNGRVVDLGFRPWSSAIPGGGFDPVVTAGGALVARSLWWATNRIPPTSTRITSKPPSSTWRTTVVFTFAGTDPDDTHLRYRYRVNSGLWKWSPSATLVLFNLPAGRAYTIQVFAVDPAGNRYANVARYTWRITG
jgi:hypothetical protein